MNITFLIGNGFDIGLGLRTSYENFYKEYCKINPYKDNSNIQNFKKLLENRSNDKYYGIRDWSDFEKAFGEHAEDFLAATKDLYIERFEDFVKAFNKYLEDEEQKANLSDKDSLAEFMKRGINTYYHIREADKNIFQNIYDRNSTERKYNFVSFNYTRILDVCARELDNLLKKEKAGLVGQVIHVHGYIDESMIMGVNDSSQIKNPDLAKDADILMEMVKPQQNIDSRTTYDIKTTDIILKSNIICIYGMSIGETDKKWWKTILTWLLNDISHRLIILSYKEEFNKRFTFGNRHFIKPIIERFLEYSGATDGQKQTVRERIHVGMNNNVFQYYLRKNDLISVYKELFESNEQKDKSLIDKYAEYAEKTKDLKRF